MFPQAKKVLVVDDQKNWRKAFERIMQKIGYEVYLATNSNEAKDMCDGYDFDIAILDIRLIDHDRLNVEGLKLLHFIQEKLPKTKTIVTTGYPECIKNVVEADAFVSKVPENSNFNVGEFQRLIESIT